MLKSASQAVGKEALKTGANFVGDLVQNKPLKQSFGQRIDEARQNLKRKAEAKLSSMSGHGIKRAKQRLLNHSSSILKGVRVSPKRTIQRKKSKKKVLKSKKGKRKVVEDIFS